MSLFLMDFIVWRLLLDTIVACFFLSVRVEGGS